MNKEEIAEYLRDNLRIEVDYNGSSAYWDSAHIKVRLILEGEEVSESRVSLPDWEEKRSEY